MATLVLPALLIGFYQSDEIHPLEIVGFTWTVIAYIWESVADNQKQSFLVAKKKEGLTN